MRPTISTTLLLVLAATAASAQAPAAAHPAPQPELKWGPAPAVLPPGAEMAVLAGDPGSNASFTVRLRFPDGYTIKPHTHPTDENLTIISGTFKIGMGVAFDTKGMMALKSGGFAIAPAKMPHFAAAQGTTVVQIQAMGPFALTYVNPADTPKAAAGK